MKCPCCSTKMKKGFLQTSGNNVIWDTKTHSFLVHPSKQGINLAYRPSCAYVENAFCCRRCKMILLPYEMENVYGVRDKT